LIRHIVMWRVKGETPVERNEARERVRMSFESLRGAIPGMHNLRIGLDVSRADYAADVVLCVDFETPAALAAYAGHPEHLRVVSELEGLRITRQQVDFPWDGDTHGV
jgi:hypothetical protein